MKKCFSLLLTLAMLLTMVPAVAAAEDAIELPVGPVAMTEDEIEMALEEEETARRHAEADVRAQQGDEVYVTELPEAAALGASRVTIKGTVNFPAPYSGVGENGIRVYAVQPAVTDETGRVTRTPGRYGSSYIDLEKGDTSASYELEVPAGDYALAVYNYADIGCPAYTYFYFNGDGTPAANEYVAKPASFTSGGKVDLTVPKAERTISGKLTFSQPLAEETYINVYGWNQSPTGGDSRVESSFLAQKGAQSVDFSFPVAPGSYPLEFSAKRWGYADVYGSLSNNYEDRMYFNVETESISGVVLNGDYILEANEEEEEETFYEVAVTVTLPEATTQWDQYMILLWDADNKDQPYDYNNCSAQRGNTSISTTFWVRKDFNYAISYMKVTNWSSFNWTDYYPSNRFLGETGTTWNYDDAKVFTCDGTNAQIAFQDTDNYKITGKLTIPTAQTSEFAAYAMVYSGDAQFGDRVFFYEEDTEAEFAIYVPTSYKGQEFTAYACKAAEARSLFLNQETYTAGDTFVLNGNQAVTDISLPESVPSVKGTYSLPSGMVAPAEGLALRFHCSDTNVYYIMPAGANSIEYQIDADIPDDTERIYVYAYVLNGPADIFPEQRTRFQVADLMKADMTNPGAVTLSGSVTVPDSCAAGASTFYLNAYGDGIDANTYLTVMPGKTSASFSIPAPKNSPIQVYTDLRADSTGTLLSGELYLQPDGSTSNDYTRVTLSEDTSAVFAIERGNIISGTITTPVDGTYRGRVYADPIYGGSVYSSPTFEFEGTTGTYKMAVPADGFKVDPAYKLYIDLYEAPVGVMTDNLYFSTEGTVFEYDFATAITVPDEGYVADFVIPKAKCITGTVTLPEGFSSNSMSTNVYVWASNKDGETRYNDYVDFNDGSSVGTYAVNLPMDFDGVCLIGLRCYQYGDAAPTPGLIADTYLYLTADGWTTNKEAAASFTPGEDGLVQDITVPTGQSTTITLKAPEGYSGEYSGDLSLQSLDDESSKYKNFSFDGTSGSLSFSTLPGDTTQYRLRIYVDSGDGVMIQRSYYYAGPGAWVTDYEKAVPISLGSGDLELSLPSGKTLTGKLVSADGDAIKIDPERFDLWFRGETSLNYARTLKEDGTFSFVIPDDATGTYLLQASPDGVSNVVDKSYYYAAGATAPCTSSDSATQIDVSGTVPELIIVVETGYVLSGVVELGEGTILTSSRDWNTQMGYVSLRLSPTGDGVSLHASADLYSEEKPWTYTFVVPKQEATYNLSISNVHIYSNDYTTSNVFTGEYYNTELGDLGTVTVTGDATLPTATLSNWGSGCEKLLLQGRHGFKASEMSADDVFTYTGPAAGQYSVTFDSRTDVNVIINGRTYWSPAGDTVYVSAPDGTLNFSYYIDSWYDSNQTFFGFGVTAIQCNEGIETGSIGSVYSGDSYADSDVLPALDDGEEITVAVSGPTDEKASVIAAIYDENGRMIGFDLVEVSFANGCAVANVGLENSAQADSMTLMLLDSFFAPFTAARTYTR